MKAVCFSDTHRTPIPFTLPEADFGLFSGDCCMPGKEAELRAFVKWFAEQPVKHKIFVPGNHDWFTEREDAKTRGIMKANGITYLNNEGVELDGIKIYGTPIQPFFCNWAHNVMEDEKRAEYYAKIPNDLDILITHCPPFGILDWVPRSFFGAEIRESVGCRELLKAVQRANPRFHVFGHIHCARGEQKAFGTHFVNAAICTEAYVLSGLPISINLDRPIPAYFSESIGNFHDGNVSSESFLNNHAEILEENEIAAKEEDL